jgi:hypothetical protein
LPCNSRSAQIFVLRRRYSIVVQLTLVRNIVRFVLDYLWAQDPKDLTVYILYDIKISVSANMGKPPMRELRVYTYWSKDR